jgi:hypothetical protein
LADFGRIDSKGVSCSGWHGDDSSRLDGCRAVLPFFSATSSVYPAASDKLFLTLSLNLDVIPKAQLHRGFGICYWLFAVILCISSCPVQRACLSSPSPLSNPPKCSSISSSAPRNLDLAQFDVKEGTAPDCLFDYSDLR